MSTVRAKVADGRKVGVLTRDDIIEALKEYGRLYGASFAQTAFSPGSAKRNGRPELVEIYYKGRPDGRPWPSLNAIKSKFGGSWNEARKAAGFGPNSTGPARGRRKAGQAEPILTVRERLVYVPDEKTKQLRARVSRLEERVTSLLEQRERLRAQVADLKARPVETVVRERPVRQAKTKTITKTKTVRVKDQKALRALERAQSKLADSEAARRAVEDQLKAEQRQRQRSEQVIAAARLDTAEASREAREATVERDRALDRLTAMESRLERLSDELGASREQLMGGAEAAAVSDLVRQAEARAEAAEVRAARAERQMAKQGAAVTGKARRLTPAELSELRSRGPAGPTVLGEALKKLASARAGRGDLNAALTEVARAAIGYRDAL